MMAVLVALPASATRVVAMDLPTLVSESDVVVRGRVLSQRAVWDGRRQRVYTDSTVLVDEIVRGQKVGTSVVVRQLGGRLGDLTQVVEGAGRLEVGQDVVLFLTVRGPLAYVVGMSQGRLAVVKKAGVEVVSRDLDGATLVGRAPAALPLTYAALRSAVRSVPAREVAE